MKIPRITDTTLRDGSHAVSHSFSPSDIENIVSKLDEAKVPVIEVSHGAGLNGSTIQQGFSHYPEFDLIEAAVKSAKTSKIASLFVPGIGTSEELKRAADIGVKVIRIAVHCTEADVTEQYFKLAKNLGLETVGFLMMSHTSSGTVLAEEAKKMESYGADCVYVIDSAGALVPEGVKERVSALKNAIAIDVGFHAHNNLGVAIGNTLAALEVGADQLDGTLRGLGAGAGNAPTELIVAVLNKMSFDTGISLPVLLDAAEEIVAPIMKKDIVLDRDNILVGYAGIYNSFLYHVNSAAEKFDVNSAEIIVELGKRKALAGQEDLIIEVAIELANKKVPLFNKKRGDYKWI